MTDDHDNKTNKDTHNTGDNNDTHIAGSEASPEPPRRNGKRRKILGTIAGIFVLAGLVWIGLYILVFSKRVVTNNAYVAGNQVVVSSQIPGTVVAVMADDTAFVRAGQPLLRLDPADADLQKAAAESALAQAVRAVRELEARAAQAESAVAAKQAALRSAKDNLQRREPLLADQAVAAETLANLREQVTVAGAELDLARRQVTAARAPISGTDIAHNPQVLQARGKFLQAWLDANRTGIVAPVSGYVANRSVQLGQRVAPGTPLMQVIPLDHLWIDANFKESDLRNVRIGQPVTVHTDLYSDDVVFHGKVVGLAAGTGAAFALLPPQNASGNWIKVVQRVPVRISLDARELEDHPLRIGLSADVNIDIRDHSGAILATTPADEPAAVTSVYDQGDAAASRAADAVILANSTDDD